ncbi:hypothetical protein LZ198_26075 [Myxococcus sp. K15C18031901]|uniref:hypothetical protein n=1 Tax=Myxococcus dinghuensis TaxID=2906761 RepID=UPI0020A834EC|nr:hypothetical protein [Myxococcus dinghuensis]MCP3102344.1 hypothetical protein [Myxococcus dinghuensis]
MLPLITVLTVLLAAPPGKTDPCNGRFQVHRGWKLEGGTFVEPSAGADLVAIDFTMRDVVDLQPFIGDAEGTAFRTDYHWVQLDAKGAPRNRYVDFFWHKANPPPVRRMAMVGAVPKGTRVVRAVLAGVCSIPVTLEASGPKWPRLPEVSVLAWRRHGPTSTALLEVRWALEAEFLRPALRRADMRLPAVAVLSVDAKARRFAKGTFSARYYLVRYWTRQGGRELEVDEIDLGEKWAPLPPREETTLPAGFDAALDEFENLAVDDEEAAMRFAQDPRIRSSR